MMIFLAILGGIFLLLLLLLCSPVGAWVTYEHGVFRVRLVFSFLSYSLSPDKLEGMLDKKEKKTPKPDSEKEEAADTDKQKKKLDAADTFAIAIELLRGAGGAWGILRRHIVFDRLRFYAVVCSGDAYTTATSYAKLSNIVLALLTIMGRTFVVRDPAVFIQPDFSHTQSRYDISLRVRVRPIFAVAAGINLLWRFLAAQPRKKSRKKAVKKYEPAASRK